MSSIITEARKTASRNGADTDAGEPLARDECRPLNTTGWTFGYRPSGKVSETRHRSYDGIPRLGNRQRRGSARVDRLCSTRKPLGQVPALTGKAQALPQRKTTLVVIIRASHWKETGTQGVASLDGGIGAGLFPKARPRGTTPRAVSLRTARGPRRYRCTSFPGDTRDILPLASSPLTPDYGDELWALPAQESVSVLLQQL